MFLDIYEFILFHLFVERNEAHYEMAKLVARQPCLQHYSYARYVEDVMFQHGPRSAGAIQNRKLFYSG